MKTYINYLLARGYTPKEARIKAAEMKRRMEEEKWTMKEKN